MKPRGEEARAIHCTSPATCCCQFVTISLPPGIRLVEVSVALGRMGARIGVPNERQHRRHAGTRLPRAGIGGGARGICS